MLVLEHILQFLEAACIPPLKRMHHTFSMATIDSYQLWEVWELRVTLLLCMTGSIGDTTPNCQTTSQQILREVEGIFPFNISLLLNLRFLSASMVPLIQKAKSYGNRIALHENYVDMYPDSPLYNFSDVAWTATAVKNAWLNKGTGVQAVQSISLKSLLFLINVYFSIKRAFT